MAYVFALPFGVPILWILKLMIRASGIEWGRTYPLGIRLRSGYDK
ncbi:hypothetical protein [Neobacillus cucumis]|nr:hypothetical protein [Neobacillus cucumis]MBM7656191.1 hypothetical protein [Neobacillus cucumis]